MEKLSIKSKDESSTNVSNHEEANIMIVDSELKMNELTKKPKSKLFSKNPHLNILLTLYQNSIYYYFLKASKIIQTSYLKYISPFEEKTNLKCLVYILDFGLVVYLNEKFFVKGSNWFNYKSDQVKISFNFEIILGRTRNNTSQAQDSPF
jgi:protein associated with RNAse G/E